MAWETKQLHPDSDDAREFLNQYPEAIESVFTEWNAFRELKYERRENIFGYTTGDLEVDEFPEVLTDDFDLIRVTNENQWQAAFVRTLQKTTEFNDPRENLPDHQKMEPWSQESVLHDEMFYTLTKYRIDIESSTGDQYTFRFDEPITNMSHVTEMASPVLNYSDTDNPTLDVYIEEDYSVQEVSSDELHGEMEQPESFFESAFSSVNLLGVYSGCFPVGFFEVRDDNIEEAENVFEMLGLYSVEVPTQYYTNLFMITYSEEKKSELENLAETPAAITLEEVYEALELPTEGAEQLAKLRAETPTFIHIPPGIEYAVYAVADGEISSELARYWPYVYYRPPFSVEGVKTALQDAKTLYNSLRENKNVFSQIEGDEISPLIDDFLMTAEQNVGWPETLSSVRPHML